MLRDALGRRPDLVVCNRFGVLEAEGGGFAAELLDLLMTRVRTIPGVTGTETFVYLKLNKQHYDWGTR